MRIKPSKYAFMLLILTVLIHDRRASNNAKDRRTILCINGDQELFPLNHPNRTISVSLASEFQESIGRDLCKFNRQVDSSYCLGYLIFTSSLAKESSWSKVFGFVAPSQLTYREVEK